MALDKQAIERKIEEIIANSEDNDDLESQLRGLVEARRGPLGRVIFVPRGAPPGITQLTIDQQITSTSIYDAKRKRKKKKYLNKKADPKYRGPIILAEGDSWFEYPCAKDLLDYVGQEYAVLSLAKAADTWFDVMSQEGKRYDDGSPQGLFANVKAESPDIVLLSVGGNEIMGDIEQFVFRYHPDRPRTEYIDKAKFGETLDYIDTQYRSVTSQLSGKCQIILHAYDFPDPRPGRDGGQWIGGPLEAYRKIGDHTLWRQIVNTMLEAAADRLNQIAVGSKNRVHFVSNFGTIGGSDYNHAPDRNMWWDEMHGTDEGFRRLSVKLISKIREISQTS